ncbi:MAG: MFS transporter [Flavobacteriales bacterium]|jgi:maltose/moltooligosaccharide transporter
MEKRRLGFWDIWNMSFGFLGIQMGFALQNANASRILQNFGADVHELSWFWLVAPLTGMIVQPIIGYYSDRTWNRLGRRKPYFLAGTLICCVALVVLPNSGAWFTAKSALLIGAGMLMLMDASINVAMEPFRALVADNLPDSQRTFGFSIQTFLIGVGAVTGSWMPWILTTWFGVSNESGPGEAPDNVVYSFYAGALVFIITILVTVWRTREYPPAEYEAIHGKAEEEHAGLSQILKDFRKMPSTMRQLGLVQFFTWFALFSMWVFTTPSITREKYDTWIQPAELAALEGIAAELPDAGAAHDLPALLSEVRSTFDGPRGHYLDNRLATHFSSGLLIPEDTLLAAIRPDITAQSGMDPAWVSSLDQVEKSRADGEAGNDMLLPYEALEAWYHANRASADERFGERITLLLTVRRVVNEHNKGGDWVGMLFGVYNFVSAGFALLLPLISIWIGRKRTHAFSLLAGGAGLISIFFIRDPLMLIVPMLGVGIAWASILAMPYAILAGSIPAGKMGVYMGIFNFFITLPQIINGVVGGPIVRYIYDGKAVYALVLAGIFLVCAAITVLYVREQNVIRMNRT